MSRGIIALLCLVVSMITAFAGMWAHDELPGCCGFAAQLREDLSTERRRADEAEVRLEEARRRVDLTACACDTWPERLSYAVDDAR